MRPSRLRLSLSPAISLLVLAGCSERSQPDAKAPETTKAPAAAAGGDRQSIDALKRVLTTDAGSTPGAPPAAAAPEPASDGSLTVADIRFQAPQGWRWTAPTSSMRAAQYEIPGGAGPAEAVVYFFGHGQGGSVEDNVARWLGQLQPAPGAPPEPRPREAKDQGGVRVTVVRAHGTYSSGVGMGTNDAPRPGWALVGLIFESPGGPLFVKITGPAATVDSAAAAIDALVASVRLSG